MPHAANIVTLILDALFAMLDIAFSIVAGYVGALATFALAGLVLFGLVFGLFALVRRLLR